MQIGGPRGANHSLSQFSTPPINPKREIGVCVCVIAERPRGFDISIRLIGPRTWSPQYRPTLAAEKYKKEAKFD